MMTFKTLLATAAVALAFAPSANAAPIAEPAAAAAPAGAVLPGPDARLVGPTYEEWLTTS